MSPRQTSSTAFVFESPILRSVSSINPFQDGYSSRMDINKMLAELRAERENIEQAIVTLERLAAGRGKRLGRPPAWMAVVKRRGRPPGSKNKPNDN